MDQESVTAPLLEPDNNNNTPGSGNSLDLGDDERSGSLISSTTNLANTILGTGMLAMPYAVASLGLLQGLLYVFVAAGIYISSSRSSILLYRTFATRKICCYSPRYSQSFVLCSSKLSAVLASCGHSHGTHFFSTQDLAVAIKCWGVSVSYLIVAGDIGSSIYSNNTQSPQSADFWISVSILAISPLTFLKRLDSLKCMYTCY